MAPIAHPTLTLSPAPVNGGVVAVVIGSPVEARLDLEEVVVVNVLLLHDVVLIEDEVLVVTEVMVEAGQEVTEGPHEVTVTILVWTTVVAPLGTSEDEDEDEDEDSVVEELLLLEVEEDEEVADEVVDGVMDEDEVTLSLEMPN